MDTLRIKKGNVMPLDLALKLHEIRLRTADDFIEAEVENWVSDKNIYIYDIKYTTFGSQSSALIIYSNVSEIA